MANSFKQTPYDGTALAADTDATIYTSPASGTAIVVGAMVTNLSAGEIKVTIKLTDSSASSTSVMLNQIPIPPNTMLELMTGNKIVLESSDALVIQTDTANSVNTFVSSLEIT